MAQQRETESDDVSKIGKNSKNEGAQSKIDLESFPHHDLVEPNMASPIIVRRRVKVEEKGTK